MQSSFFSMLSRMKYINRWGLMYNTYRESLSEHTMEVAILTQALCLLGNLRLGKSLNADRAASLALYHDAAEIITGDMPTPVKYASETIREAYRQVEESAVTRLLSLLPADLRPSYSGYFIPQEEDAYLWKLVKAADKLSALTKCIEEEKAGNTEFSSAKAATLAALHGMKLEEAELFLAEFIEAYSKTLDEQSRLCPEEA